MTSGEILDLYLLKRLIYWRNAVLGLEDAAAASLIAVLEAVKRELEEALAAHAPAMFFEGGWGPEQERAVLAFCEEALAAAKIATGETVSQAVATVAANSLEYYNNMLSLDGRVASFNWVGFSAEQIKSWFQETPLGGRSLQGWVEKAFSEGARDSLLAGFRECGVKGSGYGEMVKTALRRALDDGFKITKRQAVTLARTYVQTANVEAQMAVYKANEDLIKGYRWLSILDTGVCVRCGALDGMTWKKDERRPAMPLHPRCRCLWQPVLREEELGLSPKELNQAARPWLRRELKNIDEGGTRKVLKSGTTQENFSEWWKTLPENEQAYSVGPVRAKLLREGKISWRDLVDKSTGRLRTLNELGFTEGGKPLGPLGLAPNAPIGITKAAAGTNPNFAVNTPYAVNCQRCVPTYALRRWGYDVEAMPAPASNQPNPCRCGFECFDNTHVYGIWGNNPKVTEKALLNALQSGQEGDIYGIIWAWQGGQSAHTIVCEIVNGKPLFIDPQNGKITSNFITQNISLQHGFSYYKMKQSKISKTIDWKSIIKKIKP